MRATSWIVNSVRRVNTKTLAVKTLVKTVALANIRQKSEHMTNLGARTVLMLNIAKPEKYLLTIVTIVLLEQFQILMNNVTIVPQVNFKTVFSVRPAH
jgi:hypothetical protein